MIFVNVKHFDKVADNILFVQKLAQIGVIHEEAEVVDLVEQDLLD